MPPARPDQPSLLRLLHGAMVLLAWLLIAAALLWHVAAVLGWGGMLLAGSMVQFLLRDNDRPRHWPSQVRRWFQRPA